MQQLDYKKKLTPLKTKDGILIIEMPSLDHLIIRKNKMGDLSKHFSRKEFACKCGCGFQTVDVELLEVLMMVRSKFEASVTINSACRCEKHNKNIGGAYGSKHKRGIAADIVVKGIDASYVYSYLDSSFPDKFGVGKYDSFTHIDVRQTKARWKG